LDTHYYNDLSMEADYLKKLEEVIETGHEVVTFLHNTRDKVTAMRILTEGFQFQSHLDYTTDVVTAKDPVTIKYFSIVRQAYGNYTIIIQISKEIIEYYSTELKARTHHFSELLTLNEPFLGSEEDLIYCLAPNFVKGYINACTAEFVPNPNFNASLKLPQFDANLKRILQSPQ